MRNVLFLYVAYFLNLHAQTVDTNTSYIDITHKMISNKVVDYSDTLDIGTEKLFKIKEQKKSHTKSNNSKNIDYFFKNEKYINETDNSFVSIKLNTQFQSKYKYKKSISINAHIGLKRTNKRLNLFISGVNDNNENKKVINKDSPTEIGLNYFRADHYKIQSKYSLGIRGFHPFIRARYFKIFTSNQWKIEPVQVFKYSTKDHFQENTYVYFDKAVEEKNLLRFTLHRKTQTDINGMDYDISGRYYWNFNKKTSLSIAQIFSGNTKYKVTPSSKKYSGINNYTTALNFRKNVWKQWFFYEVNPSVNFHKENDYKANYAIVFLINIYFGNFNNKL